MITILSALVSMLSFRFRGRASLEFELVALRSADRLAAATPSPPPVSFRRPAPMGVPLLPLPMGVPLPSVAAGPRRLGNRQTGDSAEMAPQGLSDVLAVAIAPSRPSDEPRQSALGGGAHPRRTSQARHRGEPGYCRPAPPLAPQRSFPDLAQLLRNQTAIAAVDVFVVASATLAFLTLAGTKSARWLPQATDKDLRQAPRADPCTSNHST